MNPKNLYASCSEMLRRAWSALVTAYETMRELDEMAFGTLKAYLRNNW